MMKPASNAARRSSTGAHALKMAMLQVKFSINCGYIHLPKSLTEAENCLSILRTGQAKTDVGTYMAIYKQSTLRSYALCLDSALDCFVGDQLAKV